VLAEYGHAARLKRLGINDGEYAIAADRQEMRIHATEMRKFVGLALNQPDGWQKGITLLLAYTGTRRGESANLK